MPTSSLLVLGGRHIVIDCGLGVTAALVRQGIELRGLKLIFITHLHSDHYLELGPMLHTAWTAGLKSPVDMYGPAGLGDYWQHFLESMKADIELRIEDEGRPDLKGLVTLHALDEGTVIEEQGLCVRCMRNIHPPLIDSFALSFEAADRKIVFSGDTAPMPAMADFAKNADLLVHEAMLEEALPALVARVGNGDDRLMRHLKRSHSTAAQAAHIANLAGAKALALNHLIPSDDPAWTAQHWLDAVKPHFGGTLHLGTDGLSIIL